MKKFIIERDLPGAGKLSEKELQEISKTSCNTVDGLGKAYHWLETFVTENKMYCVHIAENEEVIREHSSRAGFPVKSVNEVKTMIDPTTSIR
ncbi:DUF4242 domain-containing protein [Gaoshiqia sp. Z1-71]|uniref:DUF4242 domain-containing protein n=1 Tax=Gaoshiqia hydrogeniformans TaxID=3290090 RepID=UPI003BF8E104